MRNGLCRINQTKPYTMRYLPEQGRIGRPRPSTFTYAVGAWYDDADVHMLPHVTKLTTGTLWYSNNLKLIRHQHLYVFDQQLANAPLHILTYSTSSWLTRRCISLRIQLTVT